MEDRDPTRAHARKKYGASILFSHRHKAYSGVIKDISLGGLFIATPSANLFSAGDVITVSIPFTTGEKHVKRTGWVRWTNNEGIAIEFR